MKLDTTITYQDLRDLEEHLLEANDNQLLLDVIQHEMQCRQGTSLDSIERHPNDNLYIIRYYGVTRLGDEYYNHQGEKLGHHYDTYKKKYELGTVLA